MPDPDYAAFQADPDALLAFLQNNVIATGMLPNSKLHGTPEYLTLTKNVIEVVKDGNKVGHVWYLKASDKTTADAALFSYICDYQKNELKYVMLGKAAKFCFTITMNGCTFGIGSPTTGGVLVSHCNRASDKNQSDTQRDITFDSHATGKKEMTMLEPAMYRLAPKMTATTFGIRKGKHWDFYFQSYRPNGMQWDFYGTLPIKTTSLVK